LNFFSVPENKKASGVLAKDPKERLALMQHFHPPKAGFPSLWLSLTHSLKVLAMSGEAPYH
jgi:hypothetical protein